MIETIQQAESAIAEICEWIKRQPTHVSPTANREWIKERNPYDPYGRKFHVRLLDAMESDVVEEVRDMCYDLLGAANADGACGCPLCQA